MARRIFPVVLCGGSGARLWPLSRAAAPKPLLPLLGHTTPLQAAVLRTREPGLFAPPIVVANAEHRFQVAEQVRALGVEDAELLLEPEPRNTAPAVAAAALVAMARDPDALILVTPADHHIPDTAAFQAAVTRGVAAAEQGRLVLFGIAPTGPATGYGYIRPGGEPVGQAWAVEAFVEKPDLTTAQHLVATGCLWNSGVFLLPAARLLDELAAFEPAVLAAGRAAIDAARRERDFTWLGPAFADAPSISLDHAVLERTTHAAVVAAHFAWADLGSWSALRALGDPDGDGNVLTGDVTALGAHGSYIRSEGPLVAVLGVDNLIVVATPDAVLVAARSADQDVKALVEALKARPGAPV